MAKLFVYPDRNTLGESLNTHTALMQRLLDAPMMRAAELGDVPKLQGVYVWWLDAPSHTCLKVGRALLGRRSEGLRRRIRQHLSSNEANTVLARHLAADSASPWASGRTFTSRAERKQFLATKCVFQVLALPELSQQELDAFEVYLERELRPRYIDLVRGPKKHSTQSTVDAVTNP